MTDSEQNPNIDNDFEYSRQMYYKLLTKGEEALDDMMDVARATEHPRAYEVFSTLMKNVSDINDKLMDMHKKKKDLNKTGAKQLPTPEGQTNVFIGSTTDLQRMLQQQTMIDVTPDDSDK